MNARDVIARECESWQVPYRFWLAERILEALESDGWRVVRVEPVRWEVSRNGISTIARPHDGLVRIIEEAP